MLGPASPAEYCHTGSRKLPTSHKEPHKGKGSSNAYRNQGPPFVSPDDGLHCVLGLKPEQGTHDTGGSHTLLRFSVSLNFII